MGEASKEAIASHGTRIATAIDKTVQRDSTQWAAGRSPCHNVLGPEPVCPALHRFGSFNVIDTILFQSMRPTPPSCLTNNIASGPGCGTAISKRGAEIINQDGLRLPGGTARIGRYGNDFRRIGACDPAPSGRPVARGRTDLSAGPCAGAEPSRGAVLLGEIVEQNGNLDEAVACWRRVLQLKPGFALAHNNLGVACKAQGNLNEAIACYRRALELGPDYAQAHNNLGSRLQGAGKARRGDCLLPPRRGTEAGLCRGAQQPGRGLAGAGEAGRSRRLLPPGNGTASRTCRGPQQPGQCA